MPLEVQTLLDSTISGVGDAEIFRCAVLLWCKAWQQVPCGSLEDDDSTLARACGLGRDLKTWSRMKAQVLRGFRKASDGRLYHWKVCTKAAEAWNKTAVWQWEKQCDALRKVNKGRKDAGQEPLPMPKKPEKVSCGWDRGGPLSSDGNDTDSGGGSGGLSSDHDTSSGGASDGNPTENAGREEEGNRKGSRREGNLDEEDAYASSSSPPHQPALIPDEPDRSPEADAIELWNQAARALNSELGRTEWAEVQKLTAARRTAIRARLKDCGGIEGWKAALEKAARLPWLRGETTRSPGHEDWRFNLDTLIREKFFTSLMERPDDDDLSRRQRNRQTGGHEDRLAGILEAVDS
ncbi:DUF1376 domain-containing protein [Nitrobacter sp.]|uniref:DUF1376 domain-containing protein n=1 Tax=Nitrobacter sp. TaxID=29420 RepID=UPI0029CAACFF|nr:DUF1376 domain-containing protein [Nitrobacter sp.]